MKKILCILLAISITLIVGACEPFEQDKEKDAQAEISQADPQDKENGESSQKIYELPPAGGDENDWFYIGYNPKTTIVDGFWFDFVGDDKISQWSNNYHKSRKEGTIPKSDSMLIRFIKDFNISKEDVLMITQKQKEYYAEEFPYAYLTEEEVEIIFSGDEAKINETFVTEYSICADGEIFTPEWLINHSIQEYEENDIPYEEYAQKVPLYNKVLGDNQEFKAVYEEKLTQLQAEQTE